MDELLTSIAEVSVAIAGFAGLFVAFSGRGRTLTAIERYAVLFLLFASLGAMLLALLPYVLMAFQDSESFQPWYCLLTGSALAALGTWSRLSPLRKNAGTRRFPWVRRLLMPVLWAAASIQLTPLLFAVDAYAVYALALWWLVVMAVVQFVMQIAATS